MTLYRRTVIFPSVLFLIVFCSLLIISANNMHAFLAKQVSINTENTAKSLSLSLPELLKTDNKALMVSIVNSFLDSGSYKKIQIFDINNKVLINHTYDGNIKEVPLWFKTLYPIPNASAQATILVNERPKGTVKISSFAESPYYDFWHTSITLFWWLLALYALTLLLIFSSIKNRLHSLNTLNNQAKDSTIPQRTPPHPPTLHQVTDATPKIKTPKMIEEEIVLTEKIHSQAYQDPVTGLGNRRYFDMQFQHLISEELILGALLLIELQGLKQYNETEGYKAGDQLIQQIAELIKENFLDIKLNFLTRIGGSTFAILTPNSSEEEVSQLATGLIHAIEENLNTTKDTPKVLAHIGIASLAGIKNATQILTFADQALQTARKKGSYAFSRYEHEDETLSKITSRTATEWKKYITQIVQDNLITVVYQPIISFQDKTIMSYEALLRVKETQGNLTVARLIIPMADRYGLTYALDQCVMKQVLAKVKTSASEIPYVINLSPSTLSHEPTLQWLFDTLSSGEYRNKLIVELGEYTALNNLSLVNNTAQRLIQYGVKVGIEHIGNDFSGFEYLKGLPLLYIKIDGSYVRDLNNKDTQFFINYLTKIAHSLNVKVIAECVENESQWDILHTYQLDAAQGRFLAPPELS